jgi:hypothetical protein
MVKFAMTVLLNAIVIFYKERMKLKNIWGILSRNAFVKGKA